MLYIQPQIIIESVLIKMRYFLISIIACCVFFSCKNDNKHQNESADVEYADSMINVDRTINGLDNNNDLQPKRLKDVDTISVSSNEIFLVKNVGDNHFSLQVELPNYDHSDIDRNILTWINNNLEVGNDYLNSNNNDKFESKRYIGDVFDFYSFAHFYASKHFDIYKGLQLGIDYSITCRKVYETKDVVSFEIIDFFCNYSSMRSDTNCRGATFFKYNGSMLTWAMLENSNVKEVLKSEVNNQFLKFPVDKYEEFLATSRYKDFTLPINPPYMTRDGLKFIYIKKELSDKEGNEQINCVIPLEKLNIMPSLASML